MFDKYVAQHPYIEPGFNVHDLLSHIEARKGKERF